MSILNTDFAADILHAYKPTWIIYYWKLFIVINSRPCYVHYLFSLTSLILLKAIPHWAYCVLRTRKWITCVLMEVTTLLRNSLDEFRCESSDRSWPIFLCESFAAYKMDHTVLYQSDYIAANFACESFKIQYLFMWI